MSIWVEMTSATGRKNSTVGEFPPGGWKNTNGAAVDCLSSSVKVEILPGDQSNINLNTCMAKKMCGRVKGIKNTNFQDKGWLKISVNVFRE